MFSLYYMWWPSPLGWHRYGHRYSPPVLQALDLAHPYRRQVRGTCKQTEFFVCFIQNCQFHSPSDGMRCCRSDWPGLCFFFFFFCYNQPSCFVRQQRWFWTFCLFYKFSNLPPSPSPDLQRVHICESSGSVRNWGPAWHVPSAPGLYPVSIATQEVVLNLMVGDVEL